MRNLGSLLHPIETRPSSRQRCGRNHERIKFKTCIDTAPSDRRPIRRPICRFDPAVSAGSSNKRRSERTTLLDGSSNTLALHPVPCTPCPSPPCSLSASHGNACPRRRRVKSRCQQLHSREHRDAHHLLNDAVCWDLFWSAEQSRILGVCSSEGPLLASGHERLPKPRIHRTSQDARPETHRLGL
jgi:hypothetical protein